MCVRCEGGGGVRPRLARAKLCPLMLQPTPQQPSVHWSSRLGHQATRWHAVLARPGWLVGCVAAAPERDGHLPRAKGLWHAVRREVQCRFCHRPAFFVVDRNACRFVVGLCVLW